MLQSIGMQPDLSDLLLKRASHYTADPIEQTRLAERTIDAALDNLDFIEEASPEDALYSVMHHLAQDEDNGDTSATSDAKPAADRDGQS